MAFPGKKKADQVPSGVRLKSGLALVALTILVSACAADPVGLKRVPRPLDDQQNQTARPADGGAPARQQDGQPAEEGPDTPESLTESVERESAPTVPGDAPAGQEQVAAREIDLENFKERLAGLEADEVSELLGPPNFERSEPPAKIWQYRAEKCVVDVFLYDDDGDLSVDFVEVRGRDNAEVDEKACFASVLQNPPGQAGGSEPAPSVPGGEDPPALAEPEPTVPDADEPPALAEPGPEAPGAPAPPAQPVPPVSTGPGPTQPQPDEVPDGAGGTDDGPAPSGGDAQNFQPPALPPPPEDPDLPPPTNPQVQAPAGEEIPSIPGDGPPVEEPPLVEEAPNVPGEDPPPLAGPDPVEPPSEEPPLDEPPLDEPALVEPPSAEPPLAEPPLVDPPLAEPPSAAPPAPPPAAEPAATAEPESEADRLLRELEETPPVTSDVPSAPDREAPAQDFDTEKDPDIFGDN